jgi:hypothetical protein
MQSLTITRIIVRITEDSMNVSKARNSHEHTKNFPEDYRQSGHVSSIRFASPNPYSWSLLGYFTTLSQL